MRARRAPKRHPFGIISPQRPPRGRRRESNQSSFPELASPNSGVDR